MKRGSGGLSARTLLCKANNLKGQRIMPPAKTTAIAEPARVLRGSALQIHTVEDLARVADLLFKGGVTPPGVSNPATVASVILAGLEVGLCPTQALGSIMLTNGKLSIYGDAALALVRASGLLTSIHEEVTGEGEARHSTCKVVRKGETERVFSFSMADASRAGLIKRAGTNGPWATYPDRMLMFRARGWALRDVFPDVLRGLVMHEEAADEPAVRTVTATVNEPATGQPVDSEVRQLPAAVATEVSQTQAAATGTTAALPPSDDSPIGDDQLEKIASLKSLFVAAHGLGDDREAQQSKWVELLSNYQVDSARKFTRSQAARFIEEQGKVLDPFGHPSTDLKT